MNTSTSIDDNQYFQFDLFPWINNVLYYYFIERVYAVPFTKCEKQIYYLSVYWTFHEYNKF